MVIPGVYGGNYEQDIDVSQMTGVAV